MADLGEVGNSLSPTPLPVWCLLSHAKKPGRASCSLCWTTTRWELMTWKGRPSYHSAGCLD